MSFFLQFADVFALFLVFFGLAFFLLRRFFHWFFSIQPALDSLKRIEQRLGPIEKRLDELHRRLEALDDSNSFADQAATERLKKVAQETLAPEKPDPKKRLESDFRPAAPQVQEEIERRREKRLCLHCGLPLESNETSPFCSAAHQEEYFSGNYVEPLNLPFKDEEGS